MEYVRLVLHMEVYHGSKEQRERFLDRLWNIRIGNTEKKVKDRNLKAYIDRNTLVKSDLSHVTERNLPYKGK